MTDFSFMIVKQKYPKFYKYIIGFAFVYNSISISFSLIASKNIKNAHGSNPAFSLCEKPLSVLANFLNEFVAER